MKKNMKKTDKLQNQKKRSMSMRGRRVCATALCAAVVLSTVHFLTKPAISLDEEKADDVVQSVSENVQENVADVTNETGTSSVAAELQDQTEVKASIYTDNTYQQADTEDQTEIRIKGKLPVDPETGEVEVEAKAYSTDVSNINLGEDTTAVMGYDIALYYKDEYRTEGTGDVFQPAEDSPLDVTFESAALNNALPENQFYSVYYVPDKDDVSVEEKTPELIAAENEAVQSACANAKDDVFVEGQKKFANEQAVARQNVVTSEIAKEALRDADSTSEAGKVLAKKVASEPDAINRAEFISAYDIADSKNSENQAVSTESGTTKNSFVKGTADEPLNVSENDDTTSVTFQVKHFSNYVLTTTIPKANGTNISSRIDQVSAVVSDGSKEVSSEASDGTDEKISVEGVYTLTIEMGTSDLESFGENVNAGDYFDISLPVQFDYATYKDTSLALKGNGVDGTGYFWLKGSQPMMRVVIDTVTVSELSSGRLFVANLALTIDQDNTQISETDDVLNTLTIRSVDVDDDQSTVSSANSYAKVAAYDGGISVNSVLTGASITGVSVTELNSTTAATNIVKDKYYTFKIDWSYQGSYANPPQNGDTITISLGEANNNIEYTFGDTNSVEVKDKGGNNSYGTATYDQSSNCIIITLGQNAVNLLYGGGGSIGINVMFKAATTYTLEASTGTSSKSTTVTVTEDSGNTGTDDGEYSGGGKRYYIYSDYKSSVSNGGNCALFVLQKNDDNSGIEIWDTNGNLITKKDFWSASDPVTGEDEGDWENPDAGPRDYIVGYCGERGTGMLSSETDAYKRYLIRTYAPTDERLLHEEQRKGLIYLLRHSFPFVTKEEMCNYFKGTFLNSDVTVDQITAATQQVIWDILDGSGPVEAANWHASNAGVSYSYETYANKRIVNDMTKDNQRDSTSKASNVNTLEKELLSNVKTNCKNIDIDENTRLEITSTSYENGVVTISLSRELRSNEKITFTLSDDKGNTITQEFNTQGTKTVTIPFNIANDATSIHVDAKVDPGEDYWVEYFYKHTGSQDVVSAEHIKNPYTLEDDITVTRPSTTTHKLVLKKSVENDVSTEDEFEFKVSLSNLTGETIKFNIMHGSSYIDSVPYKDANATVYSTLNANATSHEYTVNIEDDGTVTFWIKLHKDDVVTFEDLNDGAVYTFKENIDTDNWQGTPSVTINDQEASNDFEKKTLSGDTNVVFTNKPVEKKPDIKVSKVEWGATSATQNMLPGSKFALRIVNSSNQPQVVTLNDTDAITVKKLNEDGTTGDSAVTNAGNGEFEIGQYGDIISGLTPGTIYRLYETQAPDGYIKTAEYIEFTVNESGVVTVANGDDGSAFYDSDAGYLAICNKTGKKLPSTGGSGTTMIYLAGALLIAGVLVTKLVLSKRNK